MAEVPRGLRYAVVHGRFQPFHLDHLVYCRLALARAEVLVVGITNFDPALTEVEPASPHRHEAAANPFSYWERALMIRDALLEDGVAASRFVLTALPVHYPARWRHYVPTDPAQCVHVLRVFSAWEEEKARRLPPGRRGPRGGAAAGSARARLATDQAWKELVPPAVTKQLVQLNAAQRLRGLHPAPPLE